MDKRIGYGLTLEDALKMASDSTLNDLTEDELKEVRHISIGNGIIWAEKRNDGWRVYRPKRDGELHV